MRVLKFFQFVQCLVKFSGCDTARKLISSDNKSARWEHSISGSYDEVFDVIVDKCWGFAEIFKAVKIHR